MNNGGFDKLNHRGDKNMQFNEHQLELSIMELFENEGYTHQTGNDIHREKTDVLLGSLLETYLRHRYAKED